MKSIAVIGAKGTAGIRACGGRRQRVIGLDIAEMDITDRRAAYLMR